MRATGPHTLFRGGANYSLKHRTVLKLLCKITLLVADHEQIYSRRPIILDTDMLGENVRIIGQSEKRNKEKEKKN